MHSFLGLNWGEWASIIAILTFFGGLITWIFKMASKSMIAPLTNSVDQLTKSIQEFRQSSTKEHKEFKIQLDEHEDLLHDHEKRIYLIENKFLSKHKGD